VPPILPGANPATYMLECIGAGTGGKAFDCSEFYLTSALCSLNQHTMAADGYLKPGGGRNKIEFNRQYAADSRTMVDACMKKAFVSTLRLPPSLNLILFVPPPQPLPAPPPAPHLK
jgi:hypothetical protein